jgi:hypothetical protein
MVHSINIHGAFFESWCRQAVKRSGLTLTYYNYPVTWPPTNGQESSLDVRADLRKQFGGGDALLISLLIECKKNNPELTEWVFLPKQEPPAQIMLDEIDSTFDAEGLGVATPTQSSVVGGSEFVEDGRETRGDYLSFRSGSKTRTSNQAISDAAHQVCLAYRAITLQESLPPVRTIPRDQVATFPRRHLFLPLIVTTARLHVLEFLPSEVDPKTGELPLERARLRAVQHVHYEYSLPTSLQMVPPLPASHTLAGWREPFARQWVTIVSATRFEGLLANMRRSSSDNPFSAFRM